MSFRPLVIVSGMIKQLASAIGEWLTASPTADNQIFQATGVDAGAWTTDIQGLTSIVIDNITINGAVISSDTGAISFSDENLSTTGTITTGGNITAVASSGASISLSVIRYGDHAFAPQMLCAKGRGTESSPTGIQSGDGLFRFAVQGVMSNNQWSTLGSTSDFVRVSATEAWTTTAQGRDIKFLVTPNGSLSVREALVIDNNGNIVVTPGSILLRLDNSAIKLGAGEDAYIYYDGTDLNINPKAVGTGGLKLLGDLFFSGSGNGLPYGLMYTNTDIVVPVAASGTWYEANVNTPDFTSGELNLVTFTDHYLTVSKAGRYLIVFSAAISSAVAGQEVAATVMVNGTATEVSHAHGTVPVANQSITTSANAILSLAANDQISIAVQNHSTAANLTVEHAQLSITMVGG